MQSFIDMTTQERWAFDGDVVVTLCDDGRYAFSTADGTQLAVPETLVPYIPVPPNEAQLLADARATQTAKMSAACRSNLLSGFTSFALGAEFEYPSQDIDQSNLQGAVLASIGAPPGWETPVWCAAGGVWSMAPHTAEQIQEVNRDWLDLRVALQKKYVGLCARINEAGSVAEVQAISW